MHGRDVFECASLASCDYKRALRTNLTTNERGLLSKSLSLTYGFRLGLEKILGNEPGSVMIMIHADTGTSPSRETWAGGGDHHNAGPSGYG